MATYKQGFLVTGSILTVFVLPNLFKGNDFMVDLFSQGQEKNTNLLNHIIMIDYVKNIHIILTCFTCYAAKMEPAIEQAIGKLVCGCMLGCLAVDRLRCDDSTRPLRLHAWWHVLVSCAAYVLATLCCFVIESERALWRGSSGSGAASSGGGAGSGGVTVTWVWLGLRPLLLLQSTPQQRKTTA